jgi:hypothetical protein
VQETVRQEEGNETFGRGVVMQIKGEGLNAGSSLVKGRIAAQLARKHSGDEVE